VNILLFLVPADQVFGRTAWSMVGSQRWRLSSHETGCGCNDLI
jgi:hypothetical protein